MLKKLLNADDLNKSGSGKKGVEEIYKPNDQLKGFDLDDYIKNKDTNPQQYDTSKFRESMKNLNEEIETEKQKDEPITLNAADQAQAALLLWLIDKLVSGILGFVSLTHNPKKYSVSKEDRDELVQYAGPVAAKILEKFPDGILLIIGLVALYGPKGAEAISDRQQMMLKNSNEKATNNEPAI